VVSGADLVGGPHCKEMPVAATNTGRTELPGAKPMLWVAAFMLVDRRRHKTPPPEAGEALAWSMEASFGQVDHQI
jgi:hypothetical protein